MTMVCMMMYMPMAGALSVKHDLPSLPSVRPYRMVAARSSLMSLRLDSNESSSTSES